MSKKIPKRDKHEPNLRKKRKIQDAKANKQQQEDFTVLIQPLIDVYTSAAEAIFLVK